MRRPESHRRLALAVAAALPAAVLAVPTAALEAGPAAAAGPAAVPSGPAAGALTSRVIASGARWTHHAAKGREALSKPDDITVLGHHLFVAFQNGVGPQGEASPTGNRDSTVVELTLGGRHVRQWDLVGKCDGLTADPATGRIVATSNEDANSSLYLIDPVGPAVRYRYNRPLPSRGGTDAISVDAGMILITASAPGTTGAAAPRASYPAVYRTVLDAGTRVATVRPLFYDEAKATVADGPSRGRVARLGLTDPDSSEVVPASAARFAGDFMLTSQGDEEQIFVHGAGTRHQTLSLVHLSAAVDDTVWASTPTGVLYTTSGGADTVNKVTGPFHPGAVLAAVTPCSANRAPSTCPAPGWPADHLGTVDDRTGAITPVTVHGPAGVSGLLFVP